MATEIIQGNSAIITLMKNVQSKVLTLRNQNVILDADVAALYGVETRRINEAVRNNPDKFPADYIFRLSNAEMISLRSKFSTANISSKSRTLPYAFTEKSLYMLATILKSKTAVNTTLAIIETFTAIRELKRELLDLHKEPDKAKQQTKMEHFGNILSELVMPELETTETESSLELNFLIGKIKHTVKRIKKLKPNDV